MASTLTRPFAFSICASMPMRPTSRPRVFSIWVSSRSSRAPASAVCTLGSMMQSRLAPAPSTTAITSPYVHWVVQVVDPHDPGLARPVALVQRRDDVGAGVGLGQRRDRSPRGRGTPGRRAGPAPCRASSGCEPGTARQERRGRGVRRPLGAPVGSVTAVRLPTGHSAGTDGSTSPPEETTMPSPTSSSSAAGNAASGGVWPSAAAAIRAAPGISSSSASETTVGLVVRSTMLNTECPSSCAPRVSASSCSQVWPL